MDIYHTKKQTENIPRSCSYLLLKTLFYFISQCTSEPYLESGLCKLDKKLDNCNFTFISPRNRVFNESNYEVCKYRTFGYTGLFSLHIERPSYYNIISSWSILDDNYYYYLSGEIPLDNGFKSFLHHAPILDLCKISCSS